MPRRVVVVAVSLSALAFLAAGCGGGGSRDTTEWAGDVCSAITSWQDSMTDSVRSIRAAGLTRAALQSPVDDARDSTDAFVAELRDLGQPDTEAGAEAEDTINELAAGLEEGVQDIETAVTKSSTTAGAISAVTNTLTTMGNELTSTLTRLGQLDATHELQDAFEEADSCTTLVG